MNFRPERAIAAGLVVISAWAALPVAQAEVDRGVIRIAQPKPAEKADSEGATEPAPQSDARHGFDVEAFDSRFESLWFQRKAYQDEGRDEDAATTVRSHP